MVKNSLNCRYILKTMDTSRNSDRESSPDVTSYIEEKLNNTIFSGWYSERIWIEDLKGYRDRIKVDDDELLMLKNVKSIHRRVKKVRPGFTGVNRDNDNVSLFVDWSKDAQVFGHYWFLIESARLGPSNLEVRLKILRNVSGNEKSSQRCPHCGKLPLNDSSSSSLMDDPLSFSDIARQIQGKFTDIIAPSEWWTEARPHLTFVNLLKLGKFFLILLLAAISGTANFLMYALTHTNRFVHELSGFMRSATPFLMACLDSVNRLFAGFFTLIAMVWRDARRPTASEAPRQTSERLTYETNESRRNFLEGPSYPYERRDVNRPYFNK